MDLFSSTFKIAAINDEKIKNNIVLVQSLTQFAKDINSLKPVFPEESMPFMHQAGIGFYSVGLKSGKIYEWDEEENELTGEYESIEEIFDEWADAVE